MEFWGVEIKAGQKLKVNPGSKVLHLSQASLGESKKDKGNESVLLFVQVDDQKLVTGTLSTRKCRQIAYDLVFEKEFELSHNWANGSVHFCGYKSVLYSDNDDSSENESEDEEHTPIVFEENGIIPEQKDVPSKPSTDNAKSKVKVVELIKEDTDSDDSDESDDEEDFIKVEKVKEEDTDSDESDDEEDLIKVEKVKEEDTDSDDDDDDDSDEEMADSSDDEDDDDDESSDEEDETTPKKVELPGQNKKRTATPAETEPKTPTGKKAKLVTPQKIGGEGKKISGHVATPYPSKQAGKTSANKDKSKQQQSPASDGQPLCGSCKKSTKSDQARDSHSKAKRSASKR